MAEPASSRSLAPTTLGLHEELWEARNRIKGVVSWARAVALWLVTVAILGVFLVFLPISGVNLFGVSVKVSVLGGFFFLTLALVSYLTAGMVVFGLTSVLVLRDARSARRVLTRWEREMLPFFYAVKFEMLPVSESDREVDIWKRYQSLFPEQSRLEIHRILGSPQTMPVSWRVRLREAVRGKSGEHFFHIFGQASDELLLLVRRFPADRTVDARDVEALKDEAEDVLERQHAEQVVVGAFSPRGFSPDAVEVARSSRGLVLGRFPIGLVKETDRGYSVVSAGAA
jgi:hypothetical protein